MVEPSCHGLAALDVGAVESDRDSPLSAGFMLLVPKASRRTMGICSKGLAHADAECRDLQRLQPPAHVVADSLDVHVKQRIPVDR
jgi:hypothetical protein